MRRGAMAMTVAGLLATTAALAQGNLQNAVSSALEASHIFKANPGRLIEFQVTVNSCAPSTCWVLLYDSATVPSDGTTTPARFYSVTSGETLAVSWTPDALVLANGITLVCSLTGPFTKTGTANCVFAASVQ